MSALERWMSEREAVALRQRLGKVIDSESKSECGWRRKKEEGKASRN